MGVRRRSRHFSEPMDNVSPLSDRCAELRARVKALTDSTQALRERTEENLAFIRDMRKSAEGQLETLKQMVRDDAKRNGVELPEAIVEDSSPASMAIRCQFYLAAFAENLDAQNYWGNFQGQWFAHPKFDRNEFDRLLSLYNLA